MPTAIITGAGTGTGRAIALKLGENNWNLALVGRRPEHLEETARLIDRFQDKRTLVLPADVADESEVRRVIDRVHSLWGSTDALVNNAGIAPLVPIERTTPKLLDEVFRTNTFGPAFFISALIPTFKKQGHGTVINISSLAAKDPFPGFFVYAATKAALESFARSIRNEHPSISAFNIRLGAVDTDMIHGLFSEQQLSGLKLLSPDDVANVVVDCLEGRVDPDQSLIEVP